ncbi:hypothetical protein BUBS_13 [Bacillus phage Bubs]|uniref:hypothetical protein n=1 Tax=Bacillus phage Nemo TaxID=1805950 RepID=UPI0007A7718E|nr:hypothetical protein BI006_gp013 [Bacillus phage Nemo]AMW63639.1 hypothetical protein NEMO_13 [Bacillus phage Nemo]ASR78495.1 hypothetical protein BUBS_13 [Bacillus phage Bubs]
MTRHTRNKQMEKATKGKFGRSFFTGEKLGIRNIPIARFNLIELNLDKSFRWESGFEVESVHHKGNYRQQKSFGLGKFNPFYIYTFAQVSFIRKGTSEKTRVYVSHQANGRVKVEEVITESWWNNEQ